MSTIWTPGGERPVGGTSPPAAPGPSPAPAGDDRFGAPGGPELTEAELEAKMIELRRQLAETPAELVVANHAYGLFELAALHLSLNPPNLGEAQLAIDALGALIEGLAGRLGQEEDQLKEGLTQLRLAFVQMKAAAAGSGNPPV